MKFMKLGSKPDSFMTDGNNIRYVAAELATDIVVHVGDVNFHLHKFPLVSKSSRIHKLVSSANEGNGNEVHIHDIPGGPSAFEICAKFCYGMTATINAYNAAAARCAAEYLEMHETIEKGNLIYKLDVFLNSSIFRSWKDSIILLQSTKSVLRMAEELKLVNRCIDAIASKASADVSKVDCSYTYNRKKNPDGVRNQMAPDDWWVEDVSELDIDLYKRVVVLVKNKGTVSNEVIGEALKTYAYLKFPASGNCLVKQDDISKLRAILDSIVWLLPAEKGTVSCNFLLKLLKAAISVDSEERVKMELVKRVGLQLEEASVNDLLIRAREGEPLKYEVGLVRNILEEFTTQDWKAEMEMEDCGEIQEIARPRILSEASKLMVAKLVDGYLAEVAKDPNLPLSMFVSIAEMVSNYQRPSHDGLYRALDTYLKVHPTTSKSERKRICRLMDFKKLTAEASMHAVQNESLPLRVVVQILFFEQVRAANSSGSSASDLSKAVKDLNCGSYGSSRSVTPSNNDEDWDGVASAEELRALRGELAALRMGNHEAVHGKNAAENRMSSTDRAAVGKVKSLITSKKMFSKMWSSRGGQAEQSGSDSSESLGSTNQEDTRYTPARKGRHSVS